MSRHQLINKSMAESHKQLVRVAAESHQPHDHLSAVCVCLGGGGDALSVCHLTEEEEDLDERDVVPGEAAAV